MDLQHQNSECRLAAGLKICYRCVQRNSSSGLLLGACGTGTCGATRAVLTCSYECSTSLGFLSDFSAQLCSRSSFEAQQEAGSKNQQTYGTCCFQIVQSSSHEGIIRTTWAGTMSWTSQKNSPVMVCVDMQGMAAGLPAHEAMQGCLTAGAAAGTRGAGVLRLAAGLAVAISCTLAAGAWTGTKTIF